MKITYYEKNADLDEFLEDLLADKRYEEASQIKLGICYQVTEKVEDGEGTHEPCRGKGPGVTVKKVAPEFSVFMKKESNYIIIVDKYFWGECSVAKKQAWIGRLLLRFRVDPKEDGSLKISLRPWDIQDNLSSLKAFGLYSPEWLLVSDTLASMTSRQLDMAAHGQKAAAPKAEPEKAALAKAPAKPASKAPVKADPVKPAKVEQEMPSDEETPPEEQEQEEEDPPRVHACPIPSKTKASPLKSSESTPPVKSTRKVQRPADPDAALPEPA